MEFLTGREGDFIALNFTITTTATATVSPAPTLEFARSGDQLTLSWAAAGFVLQQNDNFANAAGWTDVSNGGTSPVTVTIGGGSRFFRLIER